MRERKERIHKLFIIILLRNTAQPDKSDIFMKNGNEIWDVLGDSQKRYCGPWAEIEKILTG